MKCSCEAELSLRVDAHHLETNSCGDVWWFRVNSSRNRRIGRGVWGAGGWDESTEQRPLRAAWAEAHVGLLRGVLERGHCSLPLQTSPLLGFVGGGVGWRVSFTALRLGLRGLALIQSRGETGSRVPCKLFRAIHKCMVSTTQSC